MANFFKLKGLNLEITYRIGGNPGFVALSYNDTGNNIHEGFKPAQIDSVKTDLGTMITVTTRMTIDTGGTTFSVFLPDISVPFGHSVAFNTLGIYHDVSGPIIFPKDVKVTWSSVQLEGIAETVFVPF